MGRRTRMRWVKKTPDNFYFSDVNKGAPLMDDFAVLTVTEFEAMRLKHYINLNQKDSSEKMGISQPTFSRILESAHQKITQALIEGKKILVQGGNFNFKKGFVGYGCLNCNYEWEDEKASKNRKVNCPKCNADQVYYLIREPL